MEVKITYIAKDGTEFADKDECLNYELTGRDSTTYAFDVNHVLIPFFKNGEINQEACYLWFSDEKTQYETLKQISKVEGVLLDADGFHHTWFYNQINEMWQSIDSHIKDLEKEIANLRKVEIEFENIVKGELK